MTNMLAAGVSRLQQILASSASVSVTYWRGRKSVALTATEGRSTFEVDQGSGVVTINSRDFLFPVSSLQSLEVSTATIEPKRGDVIETANGERHEVLQLNGDAVFRYSDPGKLQLRVHTKRIA